MRNAGADSEPTLVLHILMRCLIDKIGCNWEGLTPQPAPAWQRRHKFYARQWLSATRRQISQPPVCLIKNITRPSLVLVAPILPNTYSCLLQSSLGNPLCALQICGGNAVQLYLQRAGATPVLASGRTRGWQLMQVHPPMSGCK